jgi:hypothetical protein
MVIQNLIGGNNLQSTKAMNVISRTGNLGLCLKTEEHLMFSRWPILAEKYRVYLHIFFVQYYIIWKTELF